MIRLIAILISILLTSCGGSEAPQTKDTFHTNLKYISFWDSGIRVSDTDSLANNILSIKNTSKITNTATIAVVGYDYKVSTGTFSAIEEAINNNQKIILILWTGLFENAVITPDFELRMQVARESILNPYRNHIAAFYIADEPFLNAREYGASFADVKISMSRVIDTLKAEYPEIPSVITYSYVEIDNKDVEKFGPSSSWVGANLYYQHLRDSNLVKTYLDRLVAQKNKSQDIILVMDAFFIGELKNNKLICVPGTKEQGSLDVNRASIDWVNKNPSIKVPAALVFLYNNVFDRGDVICGASSMPKIVDFVSSINKKLQ